MWLVVGYGTAGSFTVTGGLRMRECLGWLQGLCSMKSMPHFKGFRVVDAVSCMFSIHSGTNTSWQGHGIFPSLDGIV